MDSGVYKILLGNGHVYYGSSKTLGRRAKSHLVALKNDKHRNPKMQAVWNKYGAYEFVVIALCPEEDLTETEQVLLTMHRDDASGVNIALSANSPMRGRPMSVLSKEKLSNAHKSSPAAIAHRLNLADQKRGKHLSDAHRKKLSEVGDTPAVLAGRISAAAKRQGVKFSDERRQNISDGLKASPASTAHMAKLHSNRIGTHLSDATKKAISDSHIRRRNVA